jgi:dTDP-4-amino-4,6-dideoxygalactose transaminase
MSAPDVSPADAALVDEVLRSSSLSLGPMVDRFEADWCARFGSRHAVAVSSGTAGLHLALLSAGVDAGDLVITSSFSFVASANVALYERAVPVFVDIDPVTFNIAPSAVAEALDDLDRGGAAAQRWLPPSLRSDRPGRVTALVPVHVFGQPAAMPSIMSAADRHGVAVIEDACEAPGAEHEGRAVGSFGAAGVFGFYPNKQMTTGEGGLIVTEDPERARLLRSLRNQGRDDDGTWLRHIRLGYNYRLDEMSAALGIGQLRRFDTLLETRARVAAAYGSRLHAIDGVTRPRIAPSTTRMSWFVYVIQLAPDIDRPAVMSALAAAGVPSRPYFSPIHLQPLYTERFGYRGGELPVTEAVATTTLALPFHGHLTDDQIDYIGTALSGAIALSRRSSAAAASLNA